MSNAKETRHKSIAFLANLTMFFLLVSIFVDLVAIISSYLEINLLNRAIDGQIITEIEAVAYDERQAFIALLQLGALIITAIFFLQWIYRAYKNLQVISVNKLLFSPRWAVGGFFVPFLNLIRPYHIMQEIWKESKLAISDLHNPKKNNTQFYLDDIYSLKERKVDNNMIVNVWWGAWIITTFVGEIILRFYSNSDTLEQLLQESWLNIVSDFFNIIGAIITIVIIKTITNWQEEKIIVFINRNNNYLDT